MTNSLLDELRVLLRVSLRLQKQGAFYSKLSHAQGQVDGYMRALLDHRLATRAEILRVVAEERAAANGPATGQLHSAERISVVV